ncbi:MFS transporter [Chloroflexota bacterium]
MLRKINRSESNPSATKVRRKLSYGWVVVIASAFIILIGGSFQYSFGVFIKPLINKFGWSRTAISASITTRSITSGLIGPIVGTLSDRYGSKKFILVGILLVGLSQILTSRITTLWHLYLFLGALAGIGISLFFVPIFAMVPKWFGDKSALGNGIVLSGFGWAQIIIPPVATYLILQYSWETCFLILGIAALVLGTVAWSFIRTPPNTVKQPQAKPIEADAPKASEPPTGVKDNYTLSEALRTPALWIMLLIFAIIAASYQMVVIHIIVAAIDIGLTSEAAAIILSLSGIGNIAGRLILGGLATKIGNKITLSFCLASQALALFFLAGASDLYAFYIIAAIHGFGYGGSTPIVFTMAGSFFGTKSIGSIIGTINAAYALGIAAGPLWAGYIFDVTGSYYTAFLYASIAVMISFLLCLLLKPPRRKTLTPYPYYYKSSTASP